MKGKFKRKVNIALSFKICYQYLPIEIYYKLYLVIRNFLVKFPGKIIHNKKKDTKMCYLEISNSKNKEDIYDNICSK